MMLKRYFWNLLISIDQFINTIFAGDPDETISSRLAKKRNENLLANLLCSALDSIDKNHCDDSIEDDEGLN